MNILTAKVNEIYLTLHIGDRKEEVKKKVLTNFVKAFLSRS